MSAASTLCLAEGKGRMRMLEAAGPDSALLHTSDNPPCTPGTARARHLPAGVGGLANPGAQAGIGEK